MERKITKLACFDFDGTLVDTELPETGKQIWKDKKGCDWPHRGWWGRQESLDIDVFENKAIEHVIEDYKKAKADENTLVIMLTGRMQTLSSHVEKVLEKHGLVFDRKLYNTGGDTLSCKLRTLDKILKEFPEIESIALWDDRETHIPTFEDWGVKTGKEFKMNVVKSERHA